MAMCMPVRAEGTELTNTETFDLMTSPDGCGRGSHYLFGMSMCLPMPTRTGDVSVMAMGNFFFADIYEQGARGRHAVSAPNWAMLDFGVDLASWNRVELDAMLTAEVWTTPADGYPQLLQIGENQADGRPFIDAQHPHSSPLMGLTITDEVSLSSQDARLLRFSFAPRGESTEGPIAFMHRPTSLWNPDAPLGHHIGQDAGHISSTVIAASLQWGTVTVEASTFHGREPEPTRVELPLGAPDSFGVRASEQVTASLLAAASFAYVSNPEGNNAIPKVLRFSASLYGQGTANEWRLHGALIWGAISNYDGASLLSSLVLEASAIVGENAIWSRIEALQRTAGELEIASSAPAAPAWTAVLTLGYTRRIAGLGPVDTYVGASLSGYALPTDFAAAYGGRFLLTGKAFFELRGIHMSSLGSP